MKPFLDNYRTLEQDCASMQIVCPVEPEKRTRLRELIANKKKSWALNALHTEFDWECLNKHCGICGFHSSAEIRGEREAIK